MPDADIAGKKQRHEREVDGLGGTIKWRIINRVLFLYFIFK